MSRVTQIPIEVYFGEGAPPCCCWEPDPPQDECEGGYCRWIAQANPPGSGQDKAWVLGDNSAFAPCVVANNTGCGCIMPAENPNNYPEYTYGNWTCFDPVTLIEIWLPPS